MSIHFLQEITIFAIIPTKECSFCSIYHEQTINLSFIFPRKYVIYMRERCKNRVIMYFFRVTAVFCSERLRISAKYPFFVRRRAFFAS